MLTEGNSIAEQDEVLISAQERQKRGECWDFGLAPRGSTSDLRGCSGKHKRRRWRVWWRGKRIGQAVIDNLESAKKAGDEFGYPLMIKSKRLAYDGRGNAVAKNEDEISLAVNALGGYARGLYVEKWAPFVKGYIEVVRPFQRLRMVNGGSFATETSSHGGSRPRLICSVPQYVCNNFSTFVCTTCSGIHREFTHRVKSVSMAKFTPQEISALQGGGNASGREIYLNGLDPQRISLPDGRYRDCINHVYVGRRYTGERNLEKPLREKMV
ncbi:hypothetical protein CASFOL_012441 [Castilleja foliolosa]|uniref:Arf-GAP domain-containing protein n=1 Tax=Castilleja foliolosa TaxID=1961234 RepID=A0ABD3DIY2_9LAMI